MSTTTSGRENRLAREASPYLVQHGKNPVDWFPWGPEALALAKSADKPILLSIGYSACHWCHVMERESFEDVEIAQLMNDGFVCIKVDREERPDLDHVYQLVVQLLGRGGGWPLTVFLTPDQHPFFGGTYFPPKPRYGSPSFRDVLAGVREAYLERRGAVVEQAEQMAKAIGTATAGEREGSGGSIPTAHLAKAYEKLAPRFDDEHGGFGSKPKFPSSMSVDLLLRHAAEDRVAEAEARVRRALDGMRSGGLWDQLGSGFHRYSTDEKWLVPHFEKMLYDNALLARLYVDAGRAFAEPRYVGVATDIASYLRREMESPAGGFYSTTDADSEGEEGRFFVFSRADVAAALGDDELAKDVAIIHFGITAEGNFEDTKTTVLSVVTSIDRVALRMSLPPSEVEHALERAKAAMFAFREQRVRPFRDEKILACWNGLVISSLAEIAATTGDEATLASATKAFARIERDLIADGRVRRFTNDAGHRGAFGFLDDHTNVAIAALDLHEATGDARYLAAARAIAKVIEEHFEDRENGGYFFTANDGETLVARTKDAYDQAVPSGAAMAATLFSRLAARDGGIHETRAAKYLEGMATPALANPFGLGQTIAAIDNLARGSVDVVLVGKDVSALRRAVYQAYAPNRTIVSVDPDHVATTPLAIGKAADASGAAVAYVCHAGTCSLPVKSAAELTKIVNAHAHR